MPPHTSQSLLLLLLSSIFPTHLLFSLPFPLFSVALPLPAPPKPFLLLFQLLLVITVRGRRRRPRRPRRQRVEERGQQHALTRSLEFAHELTFSLVASLLLLLFLFDQCSVSSRRLLARAPSFFISLSNSRRTAARFMATAAVPLSSVVALHLVVVVVDLRGQRLPLMEVPLGFSLSLSLPRFQLPSNEWVG